MSDQPEALLLAADLEMRPASYTRDIQTARLLRKQHAEIERLREQLRLANIDALNESAENAALRADAERYRWLRENALIVDVIADPDNLVQVWVGTDPANCFKARTLDAAIDAATAEERKP